MEAEEVAEATVVVAQAMSTATAVEVDMVGEEEEVLAAALVAIACPTLVLVFKNKAGVSSIARTFNHRSQVLTNLQT